MKQCPFLGTKALKSGPDFPSHDGRKVVKAAKLEQRQDASFVLNPTIPHGNL
jgi:hypothetical protein